MKLCVFDSLEHHNFKQLLDRGLHVTINSDDPAYFGGYVGENFQATQDALNLSGQDVYQVAKNSFEATFLSTEKQQALVAELDQFMDCFDA